MPSIESTSSSESLSSTLTAIATTLEESRRLAEETAFREGQIVAHLALTTGVEDIEPEGE